jgi:hypothetical protein
MAWDVQKPLTQASTPCYRQHVHGNSVQQSTFRLWMVRKFLDSMEPGQLGNRNRRDIDLEKKRECEVGCSFHWHMQMPTVLWKLFEEDRT